MTSALPLLNIVAAFVSIESKIEVSPGTCQQAKKNWLLAIKYLRLPSMYKPIIFIFMVVVAPGVTDAMFYYEANVLYFTPTNFGLLGVISTTSSIIGVWIYRMLFTKAPLAYYFLGITVVLSLSLMANLLIVTAKGSGMKIAIG